MRTPPDPRTGTTELRLEPLDWVRAITTEIPDRGQHLVRYDAWYSNRSRGARRARLPGKLGPAAWKSAIGGGRGQIGSRATQNG